MNRPARLAARIERRLRAARNNRDLRSFASRLRFDADAPQVLLSPHLDDVVLSCWGALTGQDDLVVVNVMTGEPAAGKLAAWDAATGARESAERVRERVREDERALALANRSAINLPFLDAQYRRPGEFPQLADLDSALMAFVPSASRLFAPAGIGLHADHKFVRGYALAARAAGVPVSLYAEMPYCVAHGWPAWVDGGASTDPRHDVEETWRRQIGPVPGLGGLREAVVTHLDEDAAARKRAAMLCYTTQIEGLEASVPELLGNPLTYSYELRWDLTI